MRSRAVLLHSNRCTSSPARVEPCHDGTRNGTHHGTRKGALEVLAGYPGGLRVGWRGNFYPHHSQAYEARRAIAATKRGAGTAGTNAVCSGEPKRSARKVQAV